jgi:hypothetical protein
MSVYNYTVLKSNPLHIVTLVEGVEKKILAYPIKWHGKDTWFEDLAPWVKKKWWAREYNFGSVFDWLRDKAINKWGKDRPEYGIITPGYDGKIKFNDPAYKEKGLAVFKIDGLVAWQEDDGFHECIGHVRKEGKLKVFTKYKAEETVSL